ncbi:MAG: MinD/ParA family protein [Bacillota bacterium]
MVDQAERLRLLAEKIKQETKQKAGLARARVIAVTSGKGGVGKTNITANLGIAMAQAGRRVLIIDTDLGLANADVVLGVSPQHSLSQVLKGEKAIEEIIVEGPAGVKLIAGGSGFQELININNPRLSRFLSSLEAMEEMADVILLDTGAGLSKNVLSFVLAADEVIVVTNPEPTALTDAYVTIKAIVKKSPAARPKLLINRVGDEEEFHSAQNRLVKVCQRFLGINLDVLGYILDDPNVPRAVKNQKPFLLAYPGTPASRCLKRLADKLIGTPASQAATEVKGIRGFFGRLVRSFSSSTVS